MAQKLYSFPFFSFAFLSPISVLFTWELSLVIKLKYLHCKMEQV